MKRPPTRELSSARKIGSDYAMFRTFIWRLRWPVNSDVKIPKVVFVGYSTDSGDTTQEERDKFLRRGGQGQRA